MHGHMNITKCKLIVTENSRNAKLLKIRQWLCRNVRK